VRRRWLRPLRVVLGLYVVASVLPSDPAEAQAAGELGAVNGSSAASGIHGYYTPEGLLPTAAVLDLGVPDALTTISAGPATYARASVADPGDLLANPDALLAQGAPGYDPGTLPPYPYRAAASSSSGEPVVESSPTPGLAARAQAEATASSATATMPSIQGAAIVDVGTTAATTTTSTDGSTVTVTARSEIAGFDLLGGLLHIDSLVIDLSATSDGVTTATSGQTTVSGVSVAGLAATIDDTGVHLEQGAGSTQTTAAGGLLDGVNQVLDDVLGTGVGDLNELLAAAGVQISLVQPEEAGSGTNRELVASGLRIDLDLATANAPALDQLLDSLPFVPPIAPGAPGLSDLIVLARTHQVVGYELGRARVALDARQRPDPPARPSAPIAGGTPTPGGPTASAAFPRTPAASSPLTLAPPPVARTTDTASPAVAPGGIPLGAGIGALALIGLMVAPFVGDRFAAASGWLLPGSSAERCPLEQP
jgi:hypothetical protein